MGRKNWGERVGRTMLLVVDVLFLLCAVAILIAAIICRAEVEDINSKSDILRDLNMDTILVVVIFVSSAAILGALLGFISVLKRYKRLLVFSVVIMFIVFVIQIVMGALLVGLDSTDVYNAFREDSAAGATRRMEFESKMQCCGWDYVTQEFFPEHVACVARHPTFTRTCAAAVDSFLEQWAHPTGAVLLAFSGLAFVGLVASMLIVFNARSVKEDFFENPFSF